MSVTGLWWRFRYRSRPRHGTDHDLKPLPSFPGFCLRSDVPKLEIGEAIRLEEGLVGVVLARYTRAGDVRGDVHYIVELRREAGGH